MPLAALVAILLALWYRGTWPFDGKALPSTKPKTYVAEVGYWRGRDIDYDYGTHRKTLEECRRDADDLAAYRGRNSPTRVTSSTCIVYIGDEADHRE